MRAQSVGLPDAIDADDVAELPSPACLDAGQRVFEDSALPRWQAEGTSACQERIRCRLAAQMLLLGDDPGVALVHLNEVRAPFYAELADLVIDVDDLSPDVVAARILEAVGSQDFTGAPTKAE